MQRKEAGTDVLQGNSFEIAVRKVSGSAAGQLSPLKGEDAWLKLILGF